MKKFLCLAAVGVIAASAFAWKPAHVPGRDSAPMLTKWGEAVTPENAWREYPCPQMVRSGWTNLNGIWEFAVTTNAAMATASPWAPYEPSPTVAKGDILVPFAIETPLSGVGRLMEPTELLWYRRIINVSPRRGERILLHFGGVDFRCSVFIGHWEVTDVPHEGGQAPFTLDITDFVKPGANELVVCVWDPTGKHYGAVGKQTFKPSGCMYTRMSGIWQTVWMETVPETHVTGYTAVPDIDAGTVAVTVQGTGNLSECEADVEVLDKSGAVLAKGEVEKWGRPLTLKMPRGFRLWSPDEPNLYDLRITLEDDDAKTKDVVKGYFAMRKFDMRKDVNGVLRFYLNNKPCFIYGPLDQGWWPDGFLTPPSEEAMAHDIATLKSLGCNMMRKHIKVEPARYYRLCDEMGVMLIQDMPSGWGDSMVRYGLYRKELKDVLDALRVFPSIVMWCPYNEGWGQPGAFFTHTTLDFVKRYDPSRLVNAPSGWKDYEGGDQGYRKGERGGSGHRPDGVCEAGDAVDKHQYRGPSMHAVNSRRASLLGEFGGLGHSVSGHLWNASAKNWGYGGMGDTATREGLEKTYVALIDKLAVLARKGLAGAVYTQTTDVEGELNGYMTYDRKVLKFDAAALRKAHDKVYRAARRAAETPQSAMQSVMYSPACSEWAWTTGDVPDGWTSPSFDDSKWARGKAGFGNELITKDHPEAKVATRWTTPSLRLRRVFKVGELKNIEMVNLNMFHDEDATIWLNGEKLLSVAGYNNSYEPFAVDRELFLRLVRVGDNTLAVEVKQTIGGQYIDLELEVESEK